MVSIITVNYNGWRDTCELIDSLKQHETYPYEVIVVDNASKGDDVEQLRRAHPDVCVVASERNLGFAGGNNLGLKYAKGEYLFFLNNDMILKDAVLAVMVERLKDNEIGGLSPRISYFYCPEVVQYEGRLDMAPITMRPVHPLLTDKDDYLKPKETKVMHGGAMMVRRNVVEQAGTMSEVFFLFAEEFDWSFQIKEAGFKLWYEADAVVYHKGGATIGNDSPTRAYYIARARMLFARRRRKGINRLLSCGYLTFVSMSKKVAVALYQKKWDIASSLIRGTWRGLIDKKN